MIYVLLSDIQGLKFNQLINLNSLQWHSAGVQFPRIDIFVVVVNGVVICGFVTFDVVVGKADDEEPEGAVDKEEIGVTFDDDEVDKTTDDEGVEVDGTADDADSGAGEIDVSDGHFGFRREHQHLASPCLSLIKAKKIISEQTTGSRNLLINIIVSL